MNKSMIILVGIGSVLLLFSSLSITTLSSTLEPTIKALTQTNNKKEVITGTAISGKYLNITEHHLIDKPGTPFHKITVEGKVSNFSKDKVVEDVQVIVMFYDKDNKLIIASSNSADSTHLAPSQDSRFSVSVLVFNSDIVDHYTVFGGSSQILNS